LRLIFAVLAIVLLLVGRSEPATAQEIIPLVRLTGAEADLHSFYEGRAYRLAWSAEGAPTAAAIALREALQDASMHGLSPDRYPLAAIAEAWPSAGPLADPHGFDLLMSATALRYLRDIALGRVEPAQVDPNWSIERSPLSLPMLLEHALMSEEPAQALKTIGPLHPGYAALQLGLARYQAIAAAGGWPEIPEGPSLHEGDLDPRVPLLRIRLHAESDLAVAEPPAAGEAERMDATLTAGIRRFQTRHGLEPDGVVGARTLEALNLPVERRIEQIELALERWRWMPRYLGDRHILVNIPAFSLQLYDGGRPVLESRIVVGRPTRPTPRLTAEAVGVLMNPTWTVPPTIFREDVLPKLREDPGWLAQHGMQVFQGWSADAPPLDPYSIDWSTVSGVHAPYRIVQAPGPGNSLGLLKIEMPNSPGIYLHDTPDRRLFALAERAKSSGCVRVERVRELAANLLGASLPQIDGLIAAGATTRMPLARRVPVYLAYIPVSADADGTVAFYPDLYGLDAPLSAALASERLRLAAAQIQGCGHSDVSIRG
jgi:L,D-transpeptidase YcbB